MIIGWLLGKWSVISGRSPETRQSLARLFTADCGGRTTDKKRTINKKAPRTAGVLGAGKRNSNGFDYLRTSSGPATKKVASKDKPVGIAEGGHAASIVSSFYRKGKLIEL
jgi:hypothetical protein